MYDEEKSAFFCTTCSAAGPRSCIFHKDNKGYTPGVSGKFSLDRIVDHGDSVGHLKAAETLRAKSALELAFQRSGEQEQKSMGAAAGESGAADYTLWHSHALRCGYFIAKHSLPYSMMEHICGLVQTSINSYAGKQAFSTASGTYGSYCLRDSAVDMVEICSTSILEKTVHEMREAKFFSISCDESTDVASSKNAVVMGRYVYCNAICIRMLGVVSLSSGSAKAVFDAIIELLDGRGLDIEDLIGFASDGIVAATVQQLRYTFLTTLTLDTVSTPALLELNERLGGNMQSEDEDAATFRAGGEYVQRLVAHLEERFPEETHSTVRALAMLYPDEIAKAAHIQTFGVHEIVALGKTYLPDASSSELVTEYNHYKYFAIDSFRGVGATEILKVVCSNSHMQKSHPKILTLIKIAATLAHGSVDCERAFSLQNNIKTEERSLLTCKQLNALMVCARDGPKLSNFDAEDNMKRWKNAKKRKYICS
ncbi:unnamed protein product [Lampetra fluviatilis]